jgi:hypothetical protein
MSERTTNFLLITYFLLLVQVQGQRPGEPLSQLLRVLSADAAAPTNLIPLNNLDQSGMQAMPLARRA